MDPGGLRVSPPIVSPCAKRTIRLSRSRQPVHHDLNDRALVPISQMDAEGVVRHAAGAGADNLGTLFHIVGFVAPKRFGLELEVRDAPAYTTNTSSPPDSTPFMMCMKMVADPEFVAVDELSESMTGRRILKLAHCESSTYQELDQRVPLNEPAAIGCDNLYAVFRVDVVEIHANSVQWKAVCVSVPVSPHDQKCVAVFELVMAVFK